MASKPTGSKGAASDAEAKKFFEVFLEREGRMRLPWTAEALRNSLYYNNIFHWVLPLNATRLTMDRQLAGGGIVTVPMIRRFVDIWAANMLSGDQRFVAVPSSDGSADMESAMSCSLMIAYHDSINPVRAINSRIGKVVGNAGNGFKRLYYDHDWVPVVLPGADMTALRQAIAASQKDPMAPVPKQIRGERLVGQDSWRAEMLCEVVRETYVSPFSIIPRSGCPTWQDCEEFVCHEVKPIEWVMQRFPNLAAKIIPGWTNRMGPTNASVPLRSQLYQSQSSTQWDWDQTGEAKLTAVEDYWKKLGPGRWFHGVFIRVTESNYAMAVMEEAEFPPYFSYGLGGYDGNFWAHGHTTDAQALQLALIVESTDILKNFRAQMKDILVMDPSMRGALTNQVGTTVVYADPRAQVQPRRIDVVSGVHNQLMSLISLHQSQIADCFGISATDMGSVAPRVGVGGLKLADERSGAPSAEVREDFDKEEARKYLTVLRMMQPKMDDSWWLAMSGRGGLSASKAVKSLDLTGIACIEPVPSGRIPRSPAERMQLAIQLAPTGLFEPGPETEKRLEAVQSFVYGQTTLLPVPSMLRIQENKVREELWFIANGLVVQTPPQVVNPEQVKAGAQPIMAPGPVVYVVDDPRVPSSKAGMPLFSDTDNHEMHVESIDIAYASGEIFGMIANIAMIHRQEHQNAIQQRKQEMEAEMVRQASLQSASSQMGQLLLQTGNRPDEKPPEEKAKSTPAEGSAKSAEMRKKDE